MADSCIFKQGPNDYLSTIVYVLFSPFSEEGSDRELGGGGMERLDSRGLISHGNIIVRKGLGKVGIKGGTSSQMPIGI